MSIKDKYKVESIDSKETYDWLLHKHYAKRIPPITYSFGLFKNKILIGVCTYGNALLNCTTEAICGVEYKKLVYELNRLCVYNDHKNCLSYFVSQTIKLLPKPKILISFADISQNHNGYIYQATNWIYTGITEQTGGYVYLFDGKYEHPRATLSRLGTRNHKEIIKKNKNIKYKKLGRKHRYIYFTGNKTQKKNMLKNLKYEIQPYPKGKNKRYDASYKPTIQTKLF
tara:strand:- start:556 stop:1236 length:681 start_codon:yes stop_codon:yes gene_type:complete